MTGQDRAGDENPESGDDGPSLEKVLRPLLGAHADVTANHLLASDWLAAHDRVLLADAERRILRGNWSDLAVMCIRTGFREARAALRNAR